VLQCCARELQTELLGVLHLDASAVRGPGFGPRRCSATRRLSQAVEDVSVIADRLLARFAAPVRRPPS
jgi:hypothetical protein